MILSIWHGWCPWHGYWYLEVVCQRIVQNKHFLSRYCPLCGEFIGHRWIPRTKASDAVLWCFLWSARRNGWVNNREAGDLIHHRALYDVTVMNYLHVISGKGGTKPHIGFCFPSGTAQNIFSNQTGYILHGGPSEAGDCSHPPPKMATAENPLSRKATFDNVIGLGSLRFLACQ